MADGKWQMTDGEVEATNLVVDPVVGQDSHVVTEDSTNDEIGILSHEDMDAAGVTGDEEEQQQKRRRTKPIWK